MQATLLGKLQQEMPGADVSEFAGAAQRLAEAFGSVTAAAVEPLAAGRRAGRRGPPRPDRRAPPPTGPPAGELASLYRPGQMRRRLEQLIETHRRYEHPFCLVVFDVDGPATRNGHGADAALAIVGAALRDSIRLVDEAFPLEEEALCVLAPDQNTVGGVQMSERLLLKLDRARGGGWAADRDLRRGRRLPRARRRRRGPSAQGRRSDVARPRGRPAGRRRALRRPVPARRSLQDR